jgi:hypothetical protein
VLSWNTVIETLLEYDYLQHNSNDEDGPAAAHLVRQNLRRRIKHSADHTYQQEMYGLKTQNDAHPQDLDPEIHSIQVREGCVIIVSV